MKYALYILLLAGTTAFAGYDWSRYEVIAERAPFGKEPPPSETAEAAKPAGNFAKQYRLCMLYESVSGQLKAGIVSKVNNKNFYLQVGESDGGISLVDVRLEEGVAILRQGDETAQLLLEGLGGDPAVALAQRGISAAVAALAPEPASMQQVHRAGTEAVPEHILAKLSASASKRPQITVHEVNSALPASIINAGSHLARGAKPASFPKAAKFNTNKPVAQPVTLAPMVAKVPVAANYVVQSVPERLSPF